MFSTSRGMATFIVCYFLITSAATFGAAYLLGEGRFFAGGILGGVAFLLGREAYKALR